MPWWVFNYFPSFECAETLHRYFFDTILYVWDLLKIWKNYITKLHDRPNWTETLEVEPEEEVETDENVPFILQSEMEKAIKEMWNK
jgi:hypothetical protein